MAVHPDTDEQGLTIGIYSGGALVSLALFRDVGKRSIRKAYLLHAFFMGLGNTLCELHFFGSMLSPMWHTYVATAENGPPSALNHDSDPAPLSACPCHPDGRLAPTTPQIFCLTPTGITAGC